MNAGSLAFLTKYQALVSASCVLSPARHYEEAILGDKGAKGSRPRIAAKSETGLVRVELSLTNGGGKSLY